MFFWVALAVVLVVFLVAVTWGATGMRKREHEPGTTFLD